MIYPMPNPSAATGPKPKSLRAGFPQFDVDRILVFSSAQPGSLKISGKGCLSDLDPDDDDEVTELSLAGAGSLISRWRRQYNAYRWRS